MSCGRNLNKLIAGSSRVPIRKSCSMPSVAGVKHAWKAEWHVRLCRRDRSRRALPCEDRYGIKPLYYTLTGDSLIFASEQKAILTHPDVRRDVDLEAVLEYFTFQNIFTDKTLLKGIRLVPPGNHASLSIQAGERRLQFKQFWDFDFREPEAPLSEQEYVEELDHLFRQAVTRQLVSD